MKAYLTFAILLMAGAVSAQEDNNYVLQKQYSNPLEAAKPLGTLANGNKLYALPQDNMPCIVPEMNRFAMPNAGDKMKPEQAPNSSPNPAPKIIIPAKKKASAPIYINLRGATTQK